MSDIYKIIQKHTGVNLNPQSSVESKSPWAKTMETEGRSPIFSIDRDDLSTFTNRGIAWNPSDPSYSEDQRALRQSYFDKWGNGLGKMAVYAGATTIDNTLGLLWGLGTAATGGNYWKNDVNKSMIGWMAWADEAMPNYQTKEGEGEDWHKRMLGLGSKGTFANFWADTVIKNFGFTAGAVIAGSGVSTLATKSLLKMNQKRLMSEFAKAATKNPDAVANIAAKHGKDFMQKAISNPTSNKEILKELTKISGTTRNIELGATTLATAASVGGEASIEGYHGYKDNLDHFLSMGYSAEEAEKMATNAGNVQFGLNLGILGFSNYSQFKSVFNPTRSARNEFGKLIGGSLDKGYEAAKIGMKNPSWWGKMLKNPLIEASEEMNQAWAGEFASNVVLRRYDTEASSLIEDVVNSTVKGFADSYGDYDRWEEGFAGFFTGGIGMANISKLAGGKGPIWTGGVFETYGEIQEDNKKAAEHYQVLNKVAEEIKNPYGKTVGILSHILGEEKSKTANDKFTEENEKVQAISQTFRLFQDAGKEQDYLEYLEGTSKMSAEAIRQANKFTDESGNLVDPNINKSDEELVKKHITGVEKVKEVVRKTKEYTAQVDQILNLNHKDGLEGTRDQLVSNLIAMDNSQSRFEDILSELSKGLVDKGVATPLLQTLGELVGELNSVDINNQPNEVEKRIERLSFTYDNLMDKIHELLESDESVTKSSEVLSAILKAVDEKVDESKFSKDELKRGVRGQILDVFNKSISEKQLQIFDLFALSHYNREMWKKFNDIVNDPIAFDNKTKAEEEALTDKILNDSLVDEETKKAAEELNEELDNEATANEPLEQKEAELAPSEFKVDKGDTTTPKVTPPIPGADASIVKSVEAEVGKIDQEIDKTNSQLEQMSDEVGSESDQLTALLEQIENLPADLIPLDIANKIKILMDVYGSKTQRNTKKGKQAQAIVLDSHIQKEKVKEIFTEANALLVLLQEKQKEKERLEAYREHLRKEKAYYDTLIKQGVTTKGALDSRIKKVESKMTTVDRLIKKVADVIRKGAEYLKMITRHLLGLDSMIKGFNFQPKTKEELRDLIKRGDKFEQELYSINNELYQEAERELLEALDTAELNEAVLERKNKEQDDLIKEYKALTEQLELLKRLVAESVPVFSSGPMQLPSAPKVETPTPTPTPKGKKKGMSLSELIVKINNLTDKTKINKSLAEKVIEKIKGYLKEANTIQELREVVVTIKKVKSRIGDNNANYNYIRENIADTYTERASELEKDNNEDTSTVSEPDTTDKITITESGLKRHPQHVLTGLSSNQVPMDTGGVEMNENSSMQRYHYFISNTDISKYKLKIMPFNPKFQGVNKVIDYNPESTSSILVGVVVNAKGEYINLKGEVITEEQMYELGIMSTLPENTFENPRGGEKYFLPKEITNIEAFKKVASEEYATFREELAALHKSGVNPIVPIKYAVLGINKKLKKEDYDFLPASEAFPETNSAKLSIVITTGTKADVMGGKLISTLPGRIYTYDKSTNSLKPADNLTFGQIKNPDVKNSIKNTITRAIYNLITNESKNILDKSNLKILHELLYLPKESTPSQWIKYENGKIYLKKDGKFEEVKKDSIESIEQLEQLIDLDNKFIHVSYSKLLKKEKLVIPYLNKAGEGKMQILDYKSFLFDHVLEYPVAKGREEYNLEDANNLDGENLSKDNFDSFNSYLVFDYKLKEKEVKKVTPKKKEVKEVKSTITQSTPNNKTVEQIEADRKAEFIRKGFTISPNSSKVEGSPYAIEIDNQGNAIISDSENYPEGIMLSDWLDTQGIKEVEENLVGWERELAFIQFNVVDKINAKYDAELKALEDSIEDITVPAEMFGVSETPGVVSLTDYTVIDNANLQELAEDAAKGSKGEFEELLEEAKSTKGKKKATPKKSEVDALLNAFAAPKAKTTKEVKTPKVNNQDDLLGRVKVQDESEVTEDLKEAYNYIAKTFGAEFAKKHFKPLYKIHSSKLNGYFQNAVIYVFENAEIGTTYHEAFHAVTQMFLTAKERAEIYNEFRDNFKGKKFTLLTGEEVQITETTGNLVVEELLAEDFREFNLTGNVKDYGNQSLWRRIVKFFNNLKRFFKEVITKQKENPRFDSKINELFYKINKGEFRNATILNRNTPRFNSDKISPIPGLSTSQVFEAVDSYHVRFINSLMKDENFSDIIDTETNTVPYELLYGLDKEVNRALYDRLNELATENFLGILSDSNPQHVILKEKMSDLRREHSKYLAELSLKINDPELVSQEVEVEEDNTKSEELLAKRGIELSAKETVNNVFKILLSGAPAVKMVKGKPTVDVNSLGLAKSNGRALGILINKMAGVQSFEDLAGRLLQLYAIEPESTFGMKKILSDIGIVGMDGSSKYAEILSAENPNEAKIFLLKNVLSSLSNNKNNYQATIIGKEGKIYKVDSNKNNIRNRILDKWKENYSRSNPNFVLKDGNLEQKKLAKDKLEKLNLTQLIEHFNENYGGDFKIADLELFGYDFVQSFSTNLRALLNNYDNNIYDVDSNVRGYLNELLEVAEMLSVDAVDNMHNEGTTNVYTVGMNTYHSIVLNYLNNLTLGTSITEVYKKYPYFKDSYLDSSLWLHQSLFDKDGLRTLNKIDKVMQRTFQEEGKSDSMTEFAKVDRPGKLIMVLQNTIDNEYHAIRASDNSIENTFRVEGGISNADLMLGSTTSTIFTNYLKDELNLYVNTANINFKFFNKAKENGRGILIDIIRDNGSQDLISDLDKLFSLGVVSSEAIDAFTATYESEIGTTLNEFFENEADKVLGLFYKYKLVENSGKNNSIPVSKINLETGVIESSTLQDGAQDKFSEAELSAIAKLLVVKQAIGYIEQTKLFAGHPIYFKNFVDYYKRQSGLTGTKKLSLAEDSSVIAHINKNYKRFDKKILNEENPTAKISFFKDHKQPLSPVDMKSLETLVKDSSILNAYKATINFADAMSYGTLDAVREFLNIQGIWHPNMEQRYQYEMQQLALFILNRKSAEGKVELIKQYFTNSDSVFGEHTGFEVPTKAMYKGKVITNIESLPVMPSLKPQYFGPSAGFVNNENEVIENTADKLIPIFWKTSVFPLAPSLIIDFENNQIRFPELYNLMTDMSLKQMDFKGFESASKGETVVNELYEGKVLNSDVVSTNMYYKFLGTQLELSNYYKRKLMTGTQMVAHMVSDIWDKGVAENPELEQLADTYMDLNNQRIRVGVENLKEELGIVNFDDTSFYGITQQGVDKLIERLKETAGSRNFSENELLGLERNIRENLGIDFLMNRIKLEQVLSSIADSAIKVKRYGASNAQVSEMFFKSNTEATLAAMKGDLRDIDGNIINPSDLHFYGATYEGDKIVGIKGLEIYLPNPFRGKFGKMTVEEINKLDPDVLANIIGFRIPTQGLNSIDFITIKGFLPASAGNVVVIPGGLIGKTGSDFDIDKLNIYLPNYEEVGSTISYIKFIEEKDSEKLLDRYVREKLKENKELQLLKYFEEVKEGEEGLNQFLNKLEKTNYSTKKEKFKAYERLLERQDKLLEKIEEAYNKYKDEFYSKDIYEQNGIKAIENKFNEVAVKIMSHPANFDNLVRSIDSDLIPNTRDKVLYISRTGKQPFDKDGNTTADFRAFIEELKNSNEYSKLLSVTHNLNITEELIQSKAGVGTAADHSKNHVLFQKHDIKFNETISIKYNREDKLIPSTNPFNNNESLSAKYSADNKTLISYLINLSLSGFVDGAKDPQLMQLNITPNTASLVLTMMREGVGFEEIAHFMKQPIVEQFLLNREIFESAIAEVNKFKLFREDIIQATISDLYIEKTGKFMEGDLSKEAQELFENVLLGEELANPDIFKLENLQKTLYLNNPNVGGKSFILNQVQILAEFVRAMEKGKKLNDVVQLSKFDTKGMNQDSAHLEVKLFKLIDLIERNKGGQGDFLNIEELFGDTSFIKVYKDSVKEMYSHFIKFQPLFYNSEVFPEVAGMYITYLQKYVNNISNEEKAAKALGDFKSSVVTYLISKELNINPDSVKKVVTDENTTGISVPKALLSFLDQHPDIKSVFTNYFTVVVDTHRVTNEKTGKPEYMDGIILNSQALSARDKDIIANVLRELNNINPAAVRTLYFLAMHQSGTKLSYNSFHNVFPEELVFDIANSSIQDIDMLDFERYFHATNIKNPDIVPTFKSVKHIKNSKPTDRFINLAIDLFKDSEVPLLREERRSRVKRNLPMKRDILLERVGDSYIPVAKNTFENNFKKIKSNSLATHQEEVGMKSIKKPIVIEYEDFNFIEEVEIKEQRVRNLEEKAVSLPNMKTTEVKEGVDKTWYNVFYKYVNKGFYQQFIRDLEKTKSVEEIKNINSQIRNVHILEIQNKYPQLGKINISSDGSTVNIENLEILKNLEPTLTRIMVGNHGVYLEFTNPANKGNFIKKRKQYNEYSRDGLKLYNQFETVNYADYKIDKWYADINDYKLSTQPSTQPSTIVNPEISELFKQNTELANIGTQEQYSNYLNTIFPNSPVKDIVYHGTKSADKIIEEGFKEGFEGTANRGVKGFHFAFEKEDANYYAKKDGKVLSALVNVTDKDLIDVDEILIYSNDRIHILGGKQDIQGFKDFVGGKAVSETSTELITNYGITVEDINQYMEKEGIIDLDAFLKKGDDLFSNNIKDLAAEIIKQKCKQG